MAAAIVAALVFLAPAFAQDFPTLTIRSRDAEHAFAVELAVTPAERSKGLMFRRRLDPDHGMLFDFGEERSVSMWMRNTYISLDMIFADETGMIHNIAERTEPFSTDTIPAGAPTRYVLEVKAGTAERLGIAPGDRMVVPPR